MKKIMAAILLAVFSFTLVACSSSESAEPADEEMTAQQIDLAIYKPVRSAAASYDKINTMVDQMSTGEATTEDLYTYCQQTIDWCSGWVDELDAITDSGAEDYTDVARTYVTNVGSLAIYLSDYIGENDMSALQKASDTRPLIPGILTQVNTARETYLVDAGYSSEEVEKILAAG